MLSGCSSDQDETSTPELFVDGDSPAEPTATLTSYPFDTRRVQVALVVNGRGGRDDPLTRALTREGQRIQPVAIHLENGRLHRQSFGPNRERVTWLTQVVKRAVVVWRWRAIKLSCA